MARIEQTRLPGVGVRHEFVTADGRRVGVIAHRAGHRDLVLYRADDPDAATETVRLDQADSAALAEMLGGSQVTQSIEDIRQSVEGLAIDWIPIAEGWAAEGHTIGETEMRRRTGVSIVAILRGSTTIPSPEPGEALDAGSTAVVVGTLDGIARAVALLRAG